jgi:hypothetical protein
LQESIFVASAAACFYAQRFARKTARSTATFENIRVGRRVRQRHVLYLGEINASQELAWRKSIEVLEESRDQPRTLALFPEDHCEGLLPSFG